MWTNRSSRPMPHRPSPWIDTRPASRWRKVFTPPLDLLVGKTSLSEIRFVLITKTLMKIKTLRRNIAALALMAVCGFAVPATVDAAGLILKVDYPASTNSDDLQLSVTYTIWIPEGVQQLRGVVVHQHGAGIPASEEGIAAAYDLHWQALCKEWDCALLSPSYHVRNGNTDDSPGGSQLWFDPRRGSEKAFLKVLGDFAKQSNHPELEKVPWVLWGHSGGGIWADVMSDLYPDRIAAMWLRSGSAAMWRNHTNFAAYTDPEGVYGIPIMCNSGIEEKHNHTNKATNTDPEDENEKPIMCNSGIEEKHNRPWDGPLVTIKEHRAHNGPIGFAPDPLTGHWCGNSRYLAIPFLDACLAMRLPEK